MKVKKEKNMEFRVLAIGDVTSEEGTAHLPNVRVHPSGHYMISSATFFSSSTIT